MNEIRRYTANHLKLIDKFYALILDKRKISTIRFGYVFFSNEILTLKFQSKLELKVRIIDIDYSKKFKNLSNSDALRDGFYNLEELKSELFKFYPTIENETQFTIVNFELIK